jgi:ADP-L-glycero-D-manno-heptose 6-epimerase
MIVVTGAAGFIGSALVATLNKQGNADTVVVDVAKQFNDLEPNKKKNLDKLQFREYLNKNTFLEQITGGKFHDTVDAFLHMGAITSTTEKNTRLLKENNFEYTKALAKWSVKNNIRFIYASSAATYGDGSNGFSDDEEKIEQLKPLNPYGQSKQMFDLWAKQNGLLDKIVGLKYFNVFGPNEYHKADMRSFVLKAFEQIKSTGKVRLFKSYNPKYKDGEQMRDFIYVKDAVDMTLFFLDKPDINGLFNIGTGRSRTWNDLVKAVFIAMDKKPVIEYIDMPASIKNQYQYYTCADMTKLKTAGYTKKPTLLEDAVNDYVCNFLQKSRHLGIL